MEVKKVLNVFILFLVFFITSCVQFSNDVLNSNSINLSFRGAEELNGAELSVVLYVNGNEKETQKVIIDSEKSF